MMGLLVAKHKSLEDVGGGGGSAGFHLALTAMSGHDFPPERAFPPDLHVQRQHCK